jgi:hypothetical protein
MCGGFVVQESPVFGRVHFKMLQPCSLPWIDVYFIVPLPVDCSTSQEQTHDALLTIPPKLLCWSFVTHSDNGNYHGLEEMPGFLLPVEDLLKNSLIIVCCK